MRFQRLAPDFFPQRVSLFSPQRVAPFYLETRTTTADQQTSLLVRSDRLVLGVRYEASPRARRHRNPHPRGTVARRTVAGQGLCEGLDISLHEVVVLGLVTCAGVGVVRRPQLLVGGVHSVTTNPRGSRRAAETARD